MVVKPRVTVLATGAIEQPSVVAGWTLPGVMTTGGMQTLVRGYRTVPGRRVVVAGSGPLNLQLACELLKLGVRPVAVMDEAPRPGVAGLPDLLRMAGYAPGLTAAGVGYLARLAIAGVPVIWSARVLKLSGRDRVERIEFETRAGQRTVQTDLGTQNCTSIP